MLKKLYLFSGIPYTIVSDHDKIFISKFWGELFRLQGTTLCFSTVYHPRSDGQTEVLNRCLGATYVVFPITNRNLGLVIYHGQNIGTTPFHVVYGPDPPFLLTYEASSSISLEVDQQLLDRDAILEEFR